MSSQTPLPGEPGATTELGGTTRAASPPGVDGPRRDDPGSGPDLPIPPGEEYGGAAEGSPSGNAPDGSPALPYPLIGGGAGVDPASDIAPVPAPPSTRCCSCRDIEDDPDPECVLHGQPAVDYVALARIYDLAVRGLKLAREQGDEIRCWHCDQVIAAEDPLHVHADGGHARPVCDGCDAMEGDR